MNPTTLIAMQLQLKFMADEIERLRSSQPGSSVSSVSTSSSSSSTSTTAATVVTSHLANIASPGPKSTKTVSGARYQF